MLLLKHLLMALFGRDLLNRVPHEVRCGSHVTCVGLHCDGRQQGTVGAQELDLVCRCRRVLRSVDDGYPADVGAARQAYREGHLRFAASACDGLVLARCAVRALCIDK